MTRIILAILVAILVPGLAFAQSSRPAAPRIGGPIGNVLDKIEEKNDAPRGGGILGGGNPLTKAFDDLANFIGDDIDEAIALSTALPSIQDGTGQKCLMALKTFSEVIKKHPAPLTFKIASDLEAFRLKQAAINKLCDAQECTTVFTDFTQVVTALTPIPLPVPNVHDLCAKVPRVTLGVPVTPPPALPAPVTPAQP